MTAAPKRKDTFFCSAFFFIAPCAAEGHIKLVQVQRLFQPLGLHDVGVQGATVIERVDVFLDAFWIDVN